MSIIISLVIVMALFLGMIGTPISIVLLVISFFIGEEKKYIRKMALIVFITSPVLLFLCLLIWGAISFFSVLL